ncbi:hypothetical protein LOTGIDRAFT_159535 [Lottia gigantea]|uniref:UV-stimulated scaffold protein A C-terminal domain-containing protein n=1 Tax=Lottia gigantea TaxID=225164 RepID=V4AII2_LOTGI|nr:hypothetical protein LOTGIDRAFT_159535 [Lottia gigantea]ESO96797.1 hypothetical protein LOTGIDRAFT_159535 [Lottia gigantea]
MASTSASCLDHNLCEEMSEYIEKITLSGQKTVDESLMKKLKKICRISDIYVKHAYHLLMSTLEKDHAEIRLSCFKIIDELFNRSHCFRDLLVSEFQTFLELTVGINHDLPLPAPIAISRTLRAETLKSIQQWFEKFGEAYKKLVLGYNFLKSCKMVDFNDIRNRTLAERRREEEIERKKRIVLNQKLDKVLKEMTDMVPEIETCITEIENCLNLLVPKPDDFFILNEGDTDNDDYINHSALQLNSSVIETERMCTNNSEDPSGSKNSETNDNMPNESQVEDQSGENSDADSDNDSDMEPNLNDQTAFVSDFGLGTRKYNLDIKISSDNFVIQETEDNKDIFRTLHDSVQLARKKYLLKFTKWLEILTKAGENDDKVKHLVDLKSKLKTLVDKSVEMKLTKEAVAIESDEDEDSEFEEVPEKEGYEAEVPLYLLTATEMGLKEDPKKKRGRKRTVKDWTMGNTSTSTDDPTSRAANLHKLGITDEHNQPSTSKTKHSKSQNSIPIVPFGPDIECWENQDKIEKPMVLKNDSSIWRPAEFEIEKDSASKHDVKALTTRTFHYPGKFVPVSWSCRTPLPNGSLCQRMDREKCPFHGKIIGRDKTGQPTSENDVELKIKEQLLKTEGKMADWRDHELEKDIEGALGIDLGSSSSKGKGKGKKKNKKYENLTDVKEIKNTSRNRLEKKVFNRTAMKRVTSRLDAADYKRIRDKFGNQFNYAHK